MSSCMRTILQSITNFFSAILRLNSERQSPSREENSVGNSVENSVENSVRTCEPSINNKIFKQISASLLWNQWCSFGRELGLDTVILMDLEKDDNTYFHGREETIVRMLEKWQQRVNLTDEEMVLKLKTALTEIGRNDIATKIQAENDEQDLLKKIQEVLKNFFKDVTLPTSVWLDKKILHLEELFVELTMKNVDKREEKEHKVISIEEVFLETTKKIPRRILVEGQPGYGKTTLVAKFLSDWARGENYLTDRFDLVFVIYLRYYTGNLRDHLLQHGERVKTSEENKMKVIESIKERVLLLLDGFDEIPSDVKEKIFPLIMGDDYPEMTVVVTCREGFLKLETKSDKLIKGMKIKSLETESVWDKRVKIEGVSPDKRKEFLQKYLNVNDEKLEEQLSQTNLELNDLYKCPLFLLLLAVLVMEKDIHKIKTQTELYKTIFNFVINRGLERLTEKRKELDVFDLKSESDEFHCRNLLSNFGKLCVEKIKKQSLIFEKSELLKFSNGNGDDEDFIFKLGFLSKQVIFFNYEERELYEPIHRSFLEFSAAFYLSSSNEIETELQELVSKWNIWPQKNQLLYPFLGGLLHDKALKMFNAFFAFKHLITIFNGFEYNVKEVLLEIPETEDNLKSLENLAIGDWEWVKYEKSLHFWFAGLMKKRSEEIFLNIPENLDIINGVSDDIQVNTIRVSDDGYLKKENMIIEKNIHCQNLLIILKGFNENTPMILKEMSMIKAEKVWLKINDGFFTANFGHLAEYLCKIFYENLRMTVDEKLIERFPEDLVEGIGSNLYEDLHRVLRKEFKDVMCRKVYEDFDKDNLVDWNEEVTVNLDQCFGDEIGEKLGEKICEKFGEKLNEISRDTLEDKLFEKFHEELHYVYKKVGMQCCRHFGWEIRDLCNENVYKRISENLGESELIIKKMKYVLDEVVQDQLYAFDVDELDVVVFDEDELDVFDEDEFDVVFDEDVEIDRKYKLLGEEICIRLGMKKTIVDALSEKIFCLIAIETVEKFDEELVQRNDGELFFLIKGYLDKPLKWLNEAELPFNIYHLSFLRVTDNAFHIVVPLIQDLIQKKKIEYGIKLKFVQRNNNDCFIKTYNSFVEIVSNSQLKSIGVDSYVFDWSHLPFPITSSNNEKQMEFIGLRGSFEGINVDEMKSVSVDHFDCFGLRLREENLLPQLISTFKNMKKLSCDCDLINYLGVNDSVFEREKWQTINQLKINIEYTMMGKSFLRGISLFHKVQELGLLDEKGECNIGFVARLPSLKKIRYYGSNFPNEFFKTLLDLKFEQGKRELRLDAVEFEMTYDNFNISEKAIKDLELCFQKNIFHKFSIINYDKKYDFENVLEHFISKRAFKVYCEWKKICYVDYERDKVLRNQLNICYENVK